jgi:hypothetical protein
MYTEMSLLSQHLALPRVGHLEAVYHVFAYLSKHEKSSIIFNPTDPIPIAPMQAKPDWSAFYDNLDEELPPRMPEPLGNAVNIHVFVDANHAGNFVTRRSHTGILAFVQNSPIIWVSCRQNTVETSKFGSEFVALRNAQDVIIALRYKLRINCDNQGVVKNSTIMRCVRLPLQAS